MSIGKICNREVVIVDQEASLQEAAEVMRQYHVGCVVAVEKTPAGNRPVGILTDRDLVVEVLAKQVPIEAVAVKDVMSGDLLVAHEQDDLWETIERIRDKGVRRLPVVNAKGLLVGILTVDDLIGLVGEVLQGLATLIERGQRLERKRRAAK